MTVNPSIDPARMLEEHLAQASPDLLRELLGSFINTLLSRGGRRGLRRRVRRQLSPERTNRRNGYRHRDFDTRAGTIDVAIPKLREGSYFPEWLLERRKRAERALTSVVATCYLLGVSTRRMDKLVQSLGITGLSKSQVSVMAAELDEHVEQFRTRPLATAARSRSWPPTRWCSRSARAAGWCRCTPWSRPASTPMGTARSSACRSPPARTAPAGWGSSATSSARGLSGVKLVTSDAHAGLVAAIGATLPGAAWQRCRTHYAANLMAVTPKRSWGWVKALLHSRL